MNIEAVNDSEEASDTVHGMIAETIDRFRSYDEIVDEIDRRNSKYIRNAVERAKFLLLNSNNAEGDEGAKASMNEIVNRFNEAYPDITVTIEPGNGGAYSEFIKTKDSVGEFPDVMEMRDTAMYVRAGKLEPLSEEITSLFLTTTEFDGQVYTAPLQGENTLGIIYNKKYFDENGLTEPTTYDEFIVKTTFL